MRRLLFFLTLTASVSLHARDLGFRYVKGQCVNAAGQMGLNPSYMGQCSDLRNVVISRFDMTGIDFSGSKFTNSDLQSSSFKGSTLMDVDFTAAQLQGADFEDASLTKVVFISANLGNAKFSGSKFSQVDFTLADLKDQDFSFAMFDQCNFSNSNLTGLNFSEATITNSNFSNANMETASLNKAKLNGSKFDGADMKDALLRQAVLDGASLRNTNVRGADLTGASVKNTIFEGAQYNKHTKLPFSDKDAQAKKMTLIKLAEFTGIAKNVPMASLDGWKVCSLSKYGDEVELARVMNDCGGQLLMLACRPTGSTTLTLAAYGSYDKIFTDIGESNTGTLDNGVKFYFGKEYSIGFADPAAQLQRNSCDTGGEMNDTRLCFHMSSGYMQGGYRCGDTDRLNSSQDYERLFLTVE